MVTVLRLKISHAENVLMPMQLQVISNQLFQNKMAKMIVNMTGKSVKELKLFRMAMMVKE